MKAKLKVLGMIFYEELIQLIGADGLPQFKIIQKKESVVIKPANCNLNDGKIFKIIERENRPDEQHLFIQALALIGFETDEPFTWERFPLDDKDPLGAEIEVDFLKRIDDYYIPEFVIEEFFKHLIRG